MTFPFLIHFEKLFPCAFSIFLGPFDTSVINIEDKMALRTVRYDIDPPADHQGKATRFLFPRGLQVSFEGFAGRPLQYFLQEKIDALEILVPIAFANGYDKIIVR